MSSDEEVTFYVHHDGAGHLARTLAIAAHLDRPVSLLTSLPTDRIAAPPGVEVVALPSDEVDDPEDPTACGALHWAPLHRGAVDRVAEVVAQLRRRRPSAVVIDVSVEVALLSRLAGLPTGVVRLSGQRDDPAHALCHQVATGILAPFPAAWEQPWAPRWLREHTCYAGVIAPASRATPSSRPDSERAEGAPRRVLVLWGAGSIPPDAAAIDDAATSTPGWDWVVAGPRPPGPDLRRAEAVGWLRDPSEAVSDADVVIGAPGNGTIGLVLAHARPFVALAQPRPFDEQETNAASLVAAGLAVAPKGWPASNEWPKILSEAMALEGDPRASGVGDGARRAAAWVERLASLGHAGAERGRR